MGPCRLSLFCSVALVAILSLSCPRLWAQTPDPAKAAPSEEKSGQSASPPQTEPSTDPQGAVKNPSPDGESQDAQTSEPDGKGQQTPRILGILPNFAAVSANTKLPPLSPKGKFWLATKDSFDYSAFVWTGIISAQELALNSDPTFGHGVGGYARYYWHNFVDGTSGTFFTEAIVPWISREDPRYYTMEHGSIFARLGYALSRVVLTRTDSGGTSFNWSEVGGNALEAGLSNVYYPRAERTWRQTGINWGAQLESAALNNIVKEFWPDIHRLVFRRE